MYVLPQHSVNLYSEDFPGSMSESGDFTTDGTCYSFDQFSTYSVNEYFAGNVSKLEQWTVQFKLKMSDEDDATFLYNISIECRFVIFRVRYDLVVDEHDFK